MAREILDVGDDLHLTGPGGGPADPARKGDHQTAVTALIRPDLQQIGRHHPIEAGPVEPLVGMVQFAGHGGHQGDLVGLSRGQGPDAGGKFLIIAHGVSV